jgi:hypothetical protein
MSESDSPAAQMSEASIIGQKQRFKRKFKELKLLKLEQEIRSQVVDNRLKEVGCITELLKHYQNLSSCSEIDEYAKKRFKNAFISILPDFQAEHSISPVESVPKNEGLIFTEISDETDNFPGVKESTIVDELKQALESVDDLQKNTGITDGKYEGAARVVITKLDKKTAFSIKDVIKELGLDVDHARVPAMCKTVCTRFKEARPESEMLSRQRQTYFYLHDRELMEKLVREEYAKYHMKKVDEWRSSMR